jgi:hypothetical protein
MDQTLRAVLERHLSRINVEAILRKVYQAERIEPAKMTSADLERIFQNSLFTAVRMFCEPRQLPQVMLDLADLIEDIPVPRKPRKGESTWT